MFSSCILHGVVVDCTTGGQKRILSTEQHDTIAQHRMAAEEIRKKKKLQGTFVSFHLEDVPSKIQCLRDICLQRNGGVMDTVMV